ncbi:MAG: 1-deoxy-D-xylulose-5-phosphate synthase [Candidatus Cloacimonadales bacterium]|nr:1-deoxy-D-xylulose-5-phosphate synthase [Candidatus Cloacimonadales bacterium]
MLEKIKTPDDVQNLSLSELLELARDVRKRIIEVTAKNGGHVAPSLGATDLTIALLKVFDPRIDKIVWDVGHQSYAYKILTERNERFDTLRQLNGISGFNNTFESIYDAFGVGHASTSISATLGITIAREMKNEKGQNIAVIGDGALTGGMSFEALNHAGHLQRDMIVILNDNNMSISKSVGALQAYLTNILVSRSYNTIKNVVWDFVQHLPHRIRRRTILSARKIEENLISSLAPNIIFEDLGFKYVGPIDGHNIPRMVRIFKKVVRNMNGPILIHIVTTKGKGYEPAEDDAPRFHGLGPYEIESGKCRGKNGKSYSQVFGEKLCDLAEKNDKIIAITAAMADGTGLVDFAEKFPKRFFDVGIAEQHAVTFAGGLAIQGMKPFVAIYSTFLQRAFDQIIHDIALQKLPVVFCLDRAGLVGEDGATHHGVFDLSYLSIVPNLAILAPSDAEELQMMLEFAAEYNEGPIAIRYPRGSAKSCKIEHKPIELGKYDVRIKGNDIVLIGIGKSFEDAEAIFEKMKKDFPKIKPYLINARWMKPADEKLLKELEKSVTTIFTIEENSLKGGFGESIKSRFVNSNIRVHSFGIPDQFVTYGTTDELKEIIEVTTDQIYEKIKKLLK